MDERFLALYDREIGHLRKMAGQFAKEFPKIAGRLSLDEFRCLDPYVERLLEGFAFLAARTQMKLEAEFPRFTQSILETLYPHFLAPTPSMAMVQLTPDMSEGDLATGNIKLARGTLLRAMKGKHDQSRCIYRTAHEVTLWPVDLVEAQYCIRELGALGVPTELNARAAVRLRLRAPASLPFNEIAMDSLPLYLRGIGREDMQLYEHMLAHTTGLLIQPTTSPISWRFNGGGVQRVGFDNADKLLPFDARSFQGYRLLHEYFAFPQRFMFVELTGMREGLSRCTENELDVLVLLSKAEPELASTVSQRNFVPFCTPAINLFEKRTDRIRVSDRQAELHVVPDRTRPEDFEVYQVREVTGYGVRSDQERQFKPFYSASDLDADDVEGAYYAVNRQQRQLSAKDKLYGSRSAGYVGSEMFISLVDAKAAPYSPDLRQLGVNTLCTNRDLPIRMPHGSGGSDFELDTNAPITQITLLDKTDPNPSHAHGETAWRAVSHLTLNYLSLIDDAEQGASALRNLLALYGDAADLAVRRQIEGVRSVSSHPIVRRLVRDGRIAFVRGLEITLTFDEVAFEGSGVFLLGAVLERFFAKYVSINSFTETVVKTVQRGEIMRWPAVVGQRHVT